MLKIIVDDEFAIDDNDEIDTQFLIERFWWNEMILRCENENFDVVVDVVVVFEKLNSKKNMIVFFYWIDDMKCSLLQYLSQQNCDIAFDFDDFEHTMFCICLSSSSCEIHERCAQYTEFGAED